MTRPARRGDLVVVEETTVTHMIGARNLVTTRYTVAVVTSVTREGDIKALREDHYGPGSGTPRSVHRTGPRARLLTFPKEQIDVAAAQQAAREHTWPGGQPSRPFDTLDEVRDALRSFLKQPATA